MVVGRRMQTTLTTNGQEHLALLLALLALLLLFWKLLLILKLTLVALARTRPMRRARH
jgi:hypothetical protein